MEIQASFVIRVLLSNPQSTETLNEWDKSQQNLTYVIIQFQCLYHFM